MELLQQWEYSNPHKPASVPVCSVVDVSVTTADIYTDGISTTVNGSRTPQFIHGVQGVQGPQPCTSSARINIFLVWGMIFQKAIYSVPYLKF